MRRSDTGTTPLDGADAVLADLDGVVYKGDAAIPHAVQSLNDVAKRMRVGYITNNASRTDTAVAAHLTRLGLNVRAEDVITSPQAAVRMLKRMVEAGSRILVVGGDGLVDEVEKAGFSVVRASEDGPVAVIQGFSPDVGWTQLAEAAFALESRDDMPWVATNTDWTIPVAKGIAPGNGTLVSAVHTAVGRLPEVAGKPERAIFDAAKERLGVAAPVFIGDRLDTDILGANRSGLTSVHVLTGVDGAKQLLAADADSRPDFILEDLRGLDEPYPSIEVARGGMRVSVGSSVVALEDRRVSIRKTGRSRIDLLRAACALIWGSGTPIYALDVPEELYAAR